ncbi:MAG: hypothetical protein V9E94_18575 [Microthrixaceae bacterium]
MFDAGRYDAVDTAAINNLMDGSCPERTFWFRPGKYSFDVSDAGAPAADRHALVIDDPTAKVVFGAANGWDAASGAPAELVPPGLRRRRGRGEPAALGAHHVAPPRRAGVDLSGVERDRRAAAGDRAVEHGAVPAGARVRQPARQQGARAGRHSLRHLLLQHGAAHTHVPDPVGGDRHRSTRQRVCCSSSRRSRRRCIRPDATSRCGSRAERSTATRARCRAVAPTGSTR